MVTLQFIIVLIQFVCIIIINTHINVILFQLMKGNVEPYYNDHVTEMFPPASLDQIHPHRMYNLGKKSSFKNRTPGCVSYTSTAPISWNQTSTFLSSQNYLELRASSSLTPHHNLMINRPDIFTLNIFNFCITINCFFYLQLV